jgi:hypothetical protein
MSYRIANALKRLTVSTFVRLLAVDRVRPDTPEPRCRDFGGKLCSPVGDDWLFEDNVSPISMDMRALGGELCRASTALEGLRQLLTSIAQDAPITVSADHGAVPNMMWDEDFLFEGETISAVPSVQEPLAGEAAFLFDDDTPRTGWNVLEGLRAEPPRAA